MMRLIAVCLISLPLTLPGVALAASYDAAPQVSVSPEAEPGGGTGAVVRASMEVGATPAVVWDVLTDCAGAHRYAPGLISCKILEKGNGWDIREHRLKGPVFKPVLRNVFRLTLEPHRRLSFQRTAGDWKRSDGEWKLTPLAGGAATRLDYVLHVAVEGPVPAGMVRSAVAKGMPRSMLALRREALSRAGH